MRLSKGLLQAYAVQDLTFSALMNLKELVGKEGSLVTREDAQAITGLVKAWETAQERIRIHRGKPLPGSLKPESKPKKLRAHPVIDVSSLMIADAQPAHETPKEFLTPENDPIPATQAHPKPQQ